MYSCMRASRLGVHAAPPMDDPEVCALVLATMQTSADISAVNSLNCASLTVWAAAADVCGRSHGVRTRVWVEILLTVHGMLRRLVI